ncbi:MAG TPA: zinc ribbon domain-containing protein [Anaerolineales bacterium]|nr:zinc ribbon domain-containing protein [Anaerolineales bacterium]
MPTYLYECSACEIEFEEKRSFADADAPAGCPICQGFDTRKLIAPTAFLRRGQPASVGSTEPAPARHTVGCPCCLPRRSARTRAG